MPLLEGEYAPGAESFVRFIELYPTQDGYRTDARNRLGDTYYSDRQFDEALKYYGQAAAASDDGADYARYQRAVTLGILGRTSEKIKALQQIIRDGRGDYLDDATYELGRTFVAQERYREGRSARTFRRNLCLFSLPERRVVRVGTGLPEPGRQEKVAFLL